jgi:hypothetical protein
MSFLISQLLTTPSATQILCLTPLHNTFSTAVASAAELRLLDPKPYDETEKRPSAKSNSHVRVRQTARGFRGANKVVAKVLWKCLALAWNLLDAL